MLGAAWWLISDYFRPGDAPKVRGGRNVLLIRADILDQLRDARGTLVSSQPNATGHQGLPVRLCVARERVRCCFPHPNSYIPEMIYPDMQVCNERRGHRHGRHDRALVQCPGPRLLRVLQGA